MIKAKKEKKRKLIWLIVFFIAIIILAIFIKQIQKAFIYKNFSLSPSLQPTIINSRYKTYQSNFLKIAIDIPVSFNAEEKFGTITLKKNSGDGEIDIGRNGTNYDSIEGYLRDVDDRSKLIEKTERTYKIINGLKGVESFIKYPAQPNLDHKVYYFYKDYSVYFLSTSNPNLYPDLDQIAQSFRYTP